MSEVNSNVVDLGAFSVKELSSTGVEFYLVDDYGKIVDAGETIPIKFIIYGADSKILTKAKREYSEIADLKNVKAHKVDEAALKFIGACVKTWTTFKVGDKLVENGDTNALIAFFDECPMFRDQIMEFSLKRDNFLAG